MCWINRRLLMKKSDLILCWVDTQKEVIRLRRELESMTRDKNFWYKEWTKLKEKYEPEEKEEDKEDE